MVRERPTAIRRFLIAYDGCQNAERALDFLCSLQPKRGNQAIVLNVVTLSSVPASTSRLPASARAFIRRETQAFNEEQLSRAQARVDDAVAELHRPGWSAKNEVRVGAPLERLLAASGDYRTDVLVLGARAVTGLERALLGSVANGALNLSRVPVLLVQ